MFRPSTLRSFLDGLGARACKRLSQNFLIDGNILRKILIASNICAEDFVIEIGPGPGALTESLLNQGATVLAIEKDPLFAQALKRLQTQDHRLFVFEDDALRFDLVAQLQSLLPHGKKAKLVANLPYHLTTPLITRFVQMNQWVESLTLMVQKEIALRFVASPGSMDYSSISVFLALFSNPFFCFQVEPTCFYPRPKVHSAVVHLVLKQPPDTLDLDSFLKLTRTCFGKRRKMLRSSLKDLYTPEALEKGFTTTGLHPEARPESLSLSQLIDLYSAIASPSA